MSHFSFPSDFALLVRDRRGRYRPATAEQILATARQVVDQKMQRGANFGSPIDVKAYLSTELGGPGPRGARGAVPRQSQ